MSDLTFPPVSAGQESPVWNGTAFVHSGKSSRVLAYEVGESGWSDELTALHETATESGTHFIDMASRRHAINELKRAFGSKPVSILEVGCSAGHLLADMRRSLPNATLTGGDYTLGTLVKLGIVSLVICGVAALNLVLDFDLIESGVAQGAPRYMEWYSAFGLLVTLVWLYMEILRLLSKVRRQ